MPPLSWGRHHKFIIDHSGDGRFPGSTPHSYYSINARNQSACTVETCGRGPAFSVAACFLRRCKTPLLSPSLPSLPALIPYIHPSPSPQASALISAPHQWPASIHDLAYNICGCMLQPSDAPILHLAQSGAALWSAHPGQRHHCGEHWCHSHGQALSPSCHSSPQCSITLPATLHEFACYILRALRCVRHASTPTHVHSHVLISTQHSTCPQTLQWMKATFPLRGLWGCASNCFQDA